MKIDRYRNELGIFFSGLAEDLPELTLVNRARNEIFGLAGCYRDDGDHFLRVGDRVNALASFAYASGLIDTGLFLGLFNRGSACSILLEEEDLGRDLFEHLQEKAIRYGRLLESAHSACQPSAEPGISWSDGGVCVRTVAGTYLKGGTWFLSAGRYNNALSCFSYGHGWLDAALRVGLLRITSDRELFAI